MLPYDCLVIDLHKAIDAMGLITGDTLQDEIINEIFFQNSVLGNKSLGCR